MKEYTIWMEGYVATGALSGAQYVGTTQANSFREACIKLCKDDPYFNEDNLTVWGCALFSNEQEARMMFG